MISGNDIKGTNDVHSTATGECNITGLKYVFKLWYYDNYEILSRTIILLILKCIYR